MYPDAFVEKNMHLQAFLVPAGLAWPRASLPFGWEGQEPVKLSFRRTNFSHALISKRRLPLIRYLQLLQKDTKVDRKSDKNQ